MTTNHTTEFSAEDMENVGRALMQAIETFAPKDWHPMDCPSEIVGDLTDELTRLRAEIAELRAEREAMAKQEPVAWRWHTPIHKEDEWQLTSAEPSTWGTTLFIEWQPLFASPVPIPEGYALVPKEPTPEMRDAGVKYMAPRNVYLAMLAAAPKPEAP